MEQVEIPEQQATALQASPELLDITLRSIGHAVITTDAEGCITLLNPAAECLTGWKQTEAQGRDLKEVFVVLHEESREPVEIPVEQILREGVVVSSAPPTVLLNRQGREIPIDNTSAPLRDSQGNIRGVVLVFYDGTERRQRENRRLQAQKLQSIGRLAGGVAHDFNNLLTLILGYAELTELESDLDCKAREYLRIIKQTADKAADLTRQLLAFARRQVIRPKTVDLNASILGMEKRLRRQIGAKVELTLLQEEALHPVKIDPDQFEQILLHLVRYGCDIMPEGGRITIETHNVFRDSFLENEHARQEEEFPSGEYVQLVVSDTGSGIEAIDLRHIFEPFFTTKERGRGTGLGLAAVYGSVHQAGGHIQVSSISGGGTTFHLYLPRTLETPDIASDTQR